MQPYDLCYRTQLLPTAAWEEERSWDLFISAFNPSDRVTSVFERARATEKRWLAHAEYGFASEQLPVNAPVFAHAGGGEAEYIMEFFEGRDPVAVTGRSICVDITGFMRPHLMFLVRLLAARGVRALDVLYSEPAQYAARHKTTFTKGPVAAVRQVAGFEGQHDPSSKSRDLLIVGAGYEDHLIMQVAEAKMGARKLQLFGFPPLQADFYQENVVRAELAAESVTHDAGTTSHFASAYDPFMTAAVLHDVVEEERSRRGVTNLYLSPLSTRAQALGFALYYLFECEGAAASIIYPFAREYTQDTAAGVGRLWRYTVELPNRDAC